MSKSSSESGYSSSSERKVEGNEETYGEIIELRAEAPGKIQDLKKEISDLKERKANFNDIVRSMPDGDSRNQTMMEMKKLDDEIKKIKNNLLWWKYCRDRPVTVTERIILIQDEVEKFVKNSSHADADELKKSLDFIFNKY